MYIIVYIVCQQSCKKFVSRRIKKRNPLPITENTIQNNIHNFTCSYVSCSLRWPPPISAGDTSRAKSVSTSNIRWWLRRRSSSTKCPPEGSGQNSQQLKNEWNVSQVQQKAARNKIIFLKSIQEQISRLYAKIIFYINHRAYFIVRTC